MPVINSSYVVDAHAQADGRRYVTETHTRSVGTPVIKSYLAAVGADYQSIMNARVPRINAALMAQEVNDLLDKGVISLNEQTPAQFAAAFWAILRSAYQNGDKLTYHKLVWRVWKWVQDGVLTNEQVRVSFNSFFGTSYTSGAQWNSFVTTRMAPIKDRYLALLAEQELAS